MQKPFEAVIWGGYGWGNTGDEICLAAAIDRMRSAHGDNFAVLTHSPEYTSWLFPSVNTLPYTPGAAKFSRRALRARMLSTFGRKPSPEFDWSTPVKQAKRLYLAGGGYLTDLFSLDFYLQPIIAARDSGSSIDSAPIGIGTFSSRHSAGQVADALRSTNLKVRDESSAEFCRTHNLTATMQSDDGFLLKQLLPRDLLRDRGPSNSRIGVCVFSQYGESIHYDLRGWWEKVLIGLREKFPSHDIEGFCFHTSLKYEFAEMVQLFGEAGLPVRNVHPPSLDFRHAAALLQNYDVVISTRFHAIVSANVFGIPNVAIAAGKYYLAKMKAATTGFDASSNLLNPVKDSPEALLECCQRLLHVPQPRG